MPYKDLVGSVRGTSRDPYTDGAVHGFSRVRTGIRSRDRGRQRIRRGRRAAAAVASGGTLKCKQILKGQLHIFTLGGTLICKKMCVNQIAKSLFTVIGLR